MTTPLKACLFGASPDTGNQGVNALCWSTLEGLFQRGCDDLHVFDYGVGSRRSSFGVTDFTLHGMTIGKRVWRPNHLGSARLAAAAGFRRHGFLKVVADADLVLDVSGGDSFTDLYGAARFRQITAPKQIALSLGRRLVLLPQTYGPFDSAQSRHTARKLIDGATLAFARDPDSFARLRSLLGDRFDPDRHRPGVDLAFGLPARAPRSLESSVTAAVAAAKGAPLVGLNVSGLLANRSEEARKRFGLAGDYRSLMSRLVMRLLDETAAQLLILPHVHAPRGHFESDLNASRSLLDSLPGRYAAAARDRVAVVGDTLDACELKWLIARCDWFCGARMHATIAAISSGVPTAALAYSPKIGGVFKTCAAGDAVVDLRAHDEDDALDQLLSLWQGRREAAANLARVVPKVRAHAARQLDEIAQCAGLDWEPARAVHC